MGFSKTLKGTCKIKLDALKAASHLAGSFNVDLESKRFTPTLEVKICLREPIVEKEYTITSKTVFTITKSFPPFRGEGQGETFDHPSSNQVSTNKAKSSEQVIPKPKVEVTKPEIKPQPKKPVTNQPAIDASEFTQEELDDPDIQENLNSLKVLEFKLAQIEEQMKKIDGRPPAKMREKFLKIKCRKNVLSELVVESVSIESYLLMFKKQL
jgi:hypothetical protein